MTLTNSAIRPLVNTALVLALFTAVDDWRIGMAPALAASQGPSNSARQCSQLKGKQFGNARILEAERITKGSQVSKTFAGPVIAPRDLCRARLIATPTPSSSVKIEVWLPDEWNGKMLGTGGGGTNGGLGNTDKEHAAAIARGYAGVINDVGHDASTPAKQWAYNQSERIIDFGYRGDHLAAVAGKAVIAAYYGRPPARSYFQGCSGGGREALMLAQRYPADYNGIIAGAPAADFSGLMTAGLWNSQRVHRIPEAAGLTAKLSLLRSASVAKCDMLDAVRDGVIGNPLLCTFDPADLQCKPGEKNTASCLSPGELASVREIYRGPRTSAGKEIAPGHPFGSEANLGPFITEKGIGATLLALPFFQWIVGEGPDFSTAQIDFDREYGLAKSRVGPKVDALNPDLRAFARRGGKLLIYHGWEDAVIPAGGTINYFLAVKHRMGPSAERNVRLFLLPGVSHCEGGPGPFLFDKLNVIERWTEHGMAPERITVSKYENDALAKEGQASKLIRTRPICAWPKTAKYKGTGPTDDAANFVCASEQSS